MTLYFTPVHDDTLFYREQQAECAMISERAMRVGQDIAGELGLIMDLEGNITTLTSSLI